MIIALDTDVLAGWAIAGSAGHRALRTFVERHVRRQGRIGLVPQVVFEFLHVVTDPKRFANPLSMPNATALIRDLWQAVEVVQIVPTPSVVVRTLELVDELKLGRKRLLDTALAATLEAAGVRQLATLNGQDFTIFPFLEVISPLDQDAVRFTSSRHERERQSRARLDRANVVGPKRS